MKFLARVFLYVVFAIVKFNFSTVRAAVPIRIMPLGDSITQAGNGHASYRYWLWKQLEHGAYAVDFVGSQNDIDGGDPLYTDFDPDHEGHSGWRTDEIAANILQWATDAQPDIVLLHIGHNDLWQRQTPQSTRKDIAKIINHLRAVNPSVTILLAQVIPSNGTVPKIPKLNHLIAKLAARKNTAQSPIVLVNQYAGLDAAVDTYDGVHPSESGEKKMAQKWYDALVSVLPSP